MIFIISCFFLKLLESDYVIGTNILVFHFYETMFESIGQIAGWSPRCGKSKSFIYFNSCSLISFIQILHLAQSCCELWFQSGSLFHFQYVADAGCRVPSSRHRTRHIWWHNLESPSPPQVQDCGGLR